MSEPHKRMDWGAMADEAFHRAWLRQLPLGHWRGFWALIREDSRYWGMVGNFLHEFRNEVKQAKHELTKHLPGPSKLWGNPLGHIDRLASWCADRSVRAATEEGKRG